MLARNGRIYEPAFLEPDEYRAIVESPRERGLLDAAGELLCGGGRGF